MSAPAAFLKVLTEKFRDSGVPWMLTGSAASSYYGEPRATNDLDIVVDPTPAQVETLVALLSGSFYVSRVEVREVREALAARAARRFRPTASRRGGRPGRQSRDPRLRIP